MKKLGIILLIITALAISCKEKPAHVVEFSDGSKSSFNADGELIEHIPAPKKGEN